MKLKRTLQILFCMLLACQMAMGQSAPKKKTVPYLGIYVTPISDALRKQLSLPNGVGLLISRVSKDSPAAKAGVTQHDILIGFNGQILVNGQQLRTLLRLTKAGDDAKLKIIKMGKEQTLPIKLGEREVLSRIPRLRSQPTSVSQDTEQDKTADAAMQERIRKLNQIYHDKTLSDEEKSKKINELMRKRQSSARVSVSGSSISLFSPDSIKLPAAPAKTEDFEKQIQKALDSLPESSRRHLEKKLRDENGNFKKNIRILQTPRGPVFIMEK